MEAFAERFGFRFVAHQIGNANRSARVARLHLKPLPAWIPEVYRLHQRTVDVEGYVSVNSIRYSVLVAWIGHRVEVRETRDKIEIPRGR